MRSFDHGARPHSHWQCEDPDLDRALNRALEKRNWLVHHYFWERAAEFMTRVWAAPDDLRTDGHRTRGISDARVQEIAQELIGEGG